MNNFIFFISLILFLTGNLFGQDKDIPFDKRIFEDDKLGFEEAAKEIKLGDFYFFDGRDEFVSEALSHFEKAQVFNPYSSILNYKIGICYLYSANKSKSLKHLEFAYRVNPELDVDLTFYLAQAYQLGGEFETAIEFYKKYQAILPSKDKKQHIYLAKKIAESRTGIELLNNPERVWIDNLGDSVNSEFSEFSPVISADNKRLYYTARRPDSKGQKKDRLGVFFEDIYFAQRKKDNTWSSAKNIGEPINTESHDATVGLAPDGRSILTYQGISSKNGDILITKQKTDGTWEVPHTVGVSVNSKHHESSASLSFDEKTLFFVSDQPGGYGQHDIYVSNWDEKKQEWGLAENVGPQINTIFEELGVFFHADTKTLYFSSGGHKNMGGLDIFKSTYDSESKEWSEPQNIGHPINTPDDDIYFVVTGNGRYAYYSSSRAGGYGEKDIYKVTFLGPEKEPEIPEIAIPEEEIKDDFLPTLSVQKEEDKFMLFGKVIDGETNQGILAQLYIVNAQTNQKIEVIQTHYDGSFSATIPAGQQYALTAAGKRLTISSQTLNAIDIEKNEEINLNFVLYPPNSQALTSNSFALRNVYFDFDKTNLDYTVFGSQAQVELDLLAEFMLEYPTMAIELGGHTDRRGSNDYNIRLSEDRAKIAKQYLVDKGISSQRIQTNGYGETVPEIQWSEIKSLKTKKEKEDAHQRNRRTVVTILTK